MVSTGGMDGRVRVWRRVKRNSGGGGGVEDWKNWEFLTTLETGSEITVSGNMRDRRSLEHSQRQTNSAETQSGALAQTQD
jgi:hypothetical protein